MSKVHEPIESITKRMLANSDTWPLWPLLPIKRPKPRDMPEVACLHANVTEKPHGGIIVYKCMIYDFDPSCEKITYPTVEAFLADGWIVD